MDATAVNETSEVTLELLESRLRRIEHVLHGSDTAAIAAATGPPVSPPTVEALADIENRFSGLVSDVRVYAQLLKICASIPRAVEPKARLSNMFLHFLDNACPSLFQAPPPQEPPIQLDSDAILATVLSYSSSFPTTAAGLNAALVDIPVPDAALSAQLVALVPRMQSLQESQRALDREIAELRHRSECVVRKYYERHALATANVVASVETRLERAEGRVRRLEKEARTAADEGL